MDLSFSGTLSNPPQCLSSYGRPLLVPRGQSPPLFSPPLHTSSQLPGQSLFPHVLPGPFLEEKGDHSYMAPSLGAVSRGTRFPLTSSPTTSQCDHGCLMAPLCPSLCHLSIMGTCGEEVPFGGCAHPALCPRSSTDAEVLTALGQGATELSIPCREHRLLGKPPGPGGGRAQSSEQDGGRWSTKDWPAMCVCGEDAERTGEGPT